MSKETKNTGTAARSTFSSSLGFFLAAVGGAVGLGNVWGFPFKLGRGGGFPFLVIYVLCVFVVGVPICIAEYALGRKMRSGPVSAYKRISKKWTFLGWINMAVCIGVMGFYCLICGWLLKYACMFALSLVGLGGDFLAMDSATYFTTFVAKPLEPLIWTYAFMIINYLVIRKNISQGIEKSCKVMIPALYVLFIALAIMMPFVPGSSEGYKYIFSLDPRGLLDVNVWVFAFGQCFFSLSVAGSGSVIYGSYLGKDVKIRQSAILCALFDTSAALLAMFIVIPAMATTGADLGNGGPGLMFIYLIPVFNNMGGIARIMFIFFYVAVLFAGVSSIINLFETPVAFLQEKLRFNRVTATAVIHIVGVAVALTIQPWTSQWMDMVSIYLCPLGALTAGIMFFWIMKKDTALAAVQEGDPKPVMSWFLPFGKYVFVPLCAACFILGIAFGGIG